jgi:hypothetical protein
MPILKQRGEKMKTMTLIGWLFSLQSNADQKKITDNMLKVSYPDHHLRHNPRKKEKIDESNRGGVRDDDVEGSDTVALPIEI